MALLTFFLTFVGMVDILLPRSIYAHIKLRGSVFLSKTQRIRLLVSTRSQKGAIRVSLQLLRDRLLSLVHKAPLTLLDLPAEVRNTVYEHVLTPREDGSCPGALHVLLLNKQIYYEAKPLFDLIPHRINLADVNLPNDNAGIWGMPRRVEAEWHLQSIRRLVLGISIYEIGKMTPDTFDIKVARNAKAQWRSLKMLIGIWPEAREEPLEQIMIELRHSQLDEPLPESLYAADLIRVVRNFKRTSVWAETGDCATENKSMLLPLARAFNQARRNWVSNADSDNNLLIEFGSHDLAADAADETSRGKWKIEPSDDTSRTDNQDYPPLSAIEEKYIESKMLKKSRDETKVVLCDQCLAEFDSLKEYRLHLRRGQRRSGTKV